MGNSASRPARKFTGTISKTAAPVSRANVNPLPPQKLKEQYEQRYMNQQKEASEEALQSRSPTQAEVQQKGQSSHLSDESFTSVSGTYKKPEFDASFLKKKLDSKVPEGKDGFDPQVETSFNPDFVNSISQLGRQIQSHDVRQKMDPNTVAVQQLSNRRALFKKGQQELELQNENSPNEAVIRTMLHPRTLGAVISDIHDPRFDERRITKDYQLSADFVKTLGKRFRVAANVVAIQEDQKEGEVGGTAKAVGGNGGPNVYDGAGERLSEQRLKELQLRLN